MDIIDHINIGDLTWKLFMQLFSEWKVRRSVELVHEDISLEMWHVFHLTSGIITGGKVIMKYSARLTESGGAIKSCDVTEPTLSI